MAKLTELEKIQFAEENMKLIHFLIRKLDISGDYEYDDLFGWASIGYIKAINNYDTDKGRFSTYAMRAMENEVYGFLRREKKHVTNTLSLNEIISTDKTGNNLRLENIVKDEHELMEEALFKEENRKILIETIKELSLEEQYIMISRYGLDGKKARTQNEVAQKIGKSQANISKKEKNIKKKICEMLISKHFENDI